VDESPSVAATDDRAYRVALRVNNLAGQTQ
jgi:hypothetical protein